MTYVVSRVSSTPAPDWCFAGSDRNEERIESLGYDVPGKALDFRPLWIRGRLAGGLFTSHDGIVSTLGGGGGTSTWCCFGVVLGGRGTLIGPVVGAICPAPIGPPGSPAPFSFMAGGGRVSWCW